MHNRRNDPRLVTNPWLNQPLHIPGTVPQQPVSGSPMSSSYENQWLAPEDHNKPRVSSPLARSTGGNESSNSSNTHKENSGKENTTSQQQQQQQQQHPPRKSQKDMTKAERRALQEQQRLEKQKRIAAGLPKSAKKASEMEANKKQQGQQQHQGGSGGGSNPSSGAAGGEEKKKKNKAHGKTDQNQVPWLMHLDPPKRPNTSTSNNKDLHPAVLALGLYFSERKIVGSNARCVAMLETFAKVKLEMGCLWRGY